MRVWKTVIACGYLVWIAVLSGPGYAHSEGENYVWLNVENDHLSGHFEIHLRDLRQKLDVPIGGNPETHNQELEASADRVRAYLMDTFRLTVDGEPLPLQFTTVGISEHTSSWAQYRFVTPSTGVPDSVEIENSIFLGSEDPLHRSLIVHSFNRVMGKEYGEEYAIMVFAPRTSVQALAFADLPTLTQDSQLARLGLQQTLLSPAFLMFTIGVLLTSVLTVRTGAQGPDWQPLGTVQHAVLKAGVGVTVFAVASAASLLLGLFQLVPLSAGLVQGMTVLLLVALAITNLVPQAHRFQVFVVLAFGLVFGLGLAIFLSELPFRTITIFLSLREFAKGLGFSLVVVASVSFAVFVITRRQPFYRPVLHQGGSCAVAAGAVIWYLFNAPGV